MSERRSFFAEGLSGQEVGHVSFPRLLAGGRNWLDLSKETGGVHRQWLLSTAGSRRRKRTSRELICCLTLELYHAIRWSQYLVSETSRRIWSRYLYPLRECWP